MAYANYDYYVNIFKGSILSADNFDYTAERASDFMNLITFGRIEEKEYPEFSDRIKKCCCALAENIFGQSQKNINSEKIGEYSVTYKTISDDEAGKNLRKTAVKYLLSTGLMYRGIE